MLAASLLLVLPASADAHGLGSSDPNRPVPEYLWLGFKHLLAGWDHLLFILAIVLLAGGLWQATKLMSLFVLGHSITLMLSTTQEFTVNTTFVDVVIALSVLGVAVLGLRGRPKRLELLGAGLFAVGLVHGLGLGTRLLELGVNDQSLGLKVLLFNIGVELGQAVAVLAFVGIGVLITRSRKVNEPARRYALTAIAAAGLIGAAVISLPDLGSETPTPTQAAGPSGRTIGLLVSLDQSSMVIKSQKGFETFIIRNRDRGTLGLDHLLSHAGSKIGFEVDFEADPDMSDVNYVTAAREALPSPGVTLE